MKYNNWLIHIFLCIVLFSFFSCKSTSKSDNGEFILQTKTLNPMYFNSDSAYFYVATQVGFGSRTPESKGHMRCQNWIVNTLQYWGYEVTTQQFDAVDYFGKKVKGYNILFSYNPLVNNRIVLMAHWDSRQVADNDPNQENRRKPILAADDGASGVGVILEIARQLSISKLNHNDLGIDFVLVDMEDAGHTKINGSDDEFWCQGSKYWANQIKYKQHSIRYGILLDMVGAKDAKFYFEQYSKAYASQYQNHIWDIANKLGYNDSFIKELGGAITDDHVPVIQIAGLPMVDIINYSPNRENGFGSHWHTLSDNMNIIDKKTLKIVGETVLTSIIQEE